MSNPNVDPVHGSIGDLRYTVESDGTGNGLRISWAPAPIGREVSTVWDEVVTITGVTSCGALLAINKQGRTATSPDGRLFPGDLVQPGSDKDRFVRSCPRNAIREAA